MTNKMTNEQKVINWSRHIVKKSVGHMTKELSLTRRQLGNFMEKLKIKGVIDYTFEKSGRGEVAYLYMR